MPNPKTVLYNDVSKTRVTVSLSDEVIRRLDDMALGVNRSRSQTINMLLMERFFEDVDESDPILDELCPGDFVRVGLKIIGVSSRG
jgi:hypothetical protein